MRNLLAIFHIIIIPIIIYLLSKHSPQLVFAAIIILFLSAIISFMEWLYVKTKRDKQSFLKPFADKFQVLSLLLYLTILGKFSWWILLLFLVRDIAVGMIRFRSAKDNISIRGRWYGKISTISELGVIFSVLILDFLRYEPLQLFGNLILMAQLLLIIVAIVISLISIAHYLSVYSRKIRHLRIVGRILKLERLLILVNPKSGGFTNPYRRRLLRIFARRRKAEMIVLPNSKNIYSGLKHKINSYGQIIIAGGDGSFESALNNRCFKNKSLGFFPLGAGNSYYSYFYRGKRFEYLRSRFKFKELLLDVLELKFNGRKIQTTFLSLGIDAEVIKQIKQVKNHNFADYFQAGARVAFGPKQTYPITCDVDNRKYHWENCFNLIISKIPFIGYGLRSTIGEIQPNDGLILGLAQVNTHSSFFNKGLRLWAMLLTQLGLNKAPLVSLKGKQFQVTCEREFALQAGGEFLGYAKEFTVRVKRRQKVLVI